MKIHPATATLIAVLFLSGCGKEDGTKAAQENANPKVEPAPSDPPQPPEPPTPTVTTPGDPVAKAGETIDPTGEQNPGTSTPTTPTTPGTDSSAPKSGENSGTPVAVVDNDQPPTTTTKVDTGEGTKPTSGEVIPVATKPKKIPVIDDDVRMSLPNPYDKFIALDLELRKAKVDWKDVYDSGFMDLDADEIDDEYNLCLAFGIKIADGLLAIKSKNVEDLNSCATQIEKIAAKLGVSDGELSRARSVKRSAQKEDWLTVFMELGFLQSDIMKALRRDTKKWTKDRRILIIASGWMQGARYTSYAIEKHYTAGASNILRNPLLMKYLQRDVGLLSAELKGRDNIKKLSAALPIMYAIVDIPRNGTIPKEQVSELYRVTTDVVDALVGD